MIFAGAATFLLLLYLLPLFLRRVRHERHGGEIDVFSPELFLALFGLLQLPYLYLLGVSRNYASLDLRMTSWVRDPEATALWFALLIGAGFVLTLAGIHSRWAGWFAVRLPMLSAERFTPDRVRRAWIWGGLLGVMLYLYFIQSIGGLANLWAHMYLRSTLMQGMGYLGAAYNLLLTASAGLVVFSLRDRHGKARMVVVAVVVLFIVVLMGSTGGRSPTLTVFALAVLTYHYGVRRRRRLLTPVTAVVIVLLSAFVVIAPLFRRDDALARYSASPQYLMVDAFEGFATVAPNLSGFDRVAVMLNYFTPRRLWWGRSYIDLLAAPIPRTVFPNKPPVDDGIYFYEIVYGHLVRPSLPAREMQETSWPMGTFVTYMNFWIPGFLFASYLVGMIIGGTYQYLERTNFAPSAIFLYQFAVMGGIQLSVYGIMLMLMTGGLALIYFWLFFAPKSIAPPEPTPLVA